MFSKSRTLISVLSAIFCTAAWGQTKPAAYVYISSNYSDSNNRTVGFSANAKGQLTPISGSPWANNIAYLAVNGKYLFGSDNVPNDGGRNIYSYLIGSNGALKYIGATNIQKTASENSCNSGGDLLLDHTGSYLYVFVGEADCDSEVAYQSFGVNASTGSLRYLGLTTPNPFTLGPGLTMATDNLWAYAAGGDGMYSAITGFKKESNGALSTLSANMPFPGGGPSNSFGYVGPDAADTTNHLAVNTYWVTNNSEYDKVATYAINTTNGNLTTSSTYSNMSETLVSQVTSMAMAPSGKLLALGGSNGLQIFNFNPSGQATPATQLITRAPITGMYWDNSNHLYAISNADSAIHVFTVTSTDATEVEGSPWTVEHPVAMIVQPE